MRTALGGTGLQVPAPGALATYQPATCPIYVCVCVCVMQRMNNSKERIKGLAVRTHCPPT